MYCSLINKKTVEVFYKMSRELISQIESTVGNSNIPLHTKDIVRTINRKNVTKKIVNSILYKNPQFIKVNNTPPLWSIVNSNPQENSLTDEIGEKSTSDTEELVNPFIVEMIQEVLQEQCSCMLFVTLWKHVNSKTTVTAHRLDTTLKINSCFRRVNSNPLIWAIDGLEYQDDLMTILDRERSIKVNVIDILFEGILSINEIYERLSVNDLEDVTIVDVSRVLESDVMFKELNNHSWKICNAF